MAEDDTSSPDKTAAEKLAEALARKRSAGGGASRAPGPRSSERADAARSASKSRPALRKG